MNKRKLSRIYAWYERLSLYSRADSKELPGNKVFSLGAIGIMLLMLMPLSFPQNAQAAPGDLLLTINNRERFIEYALLPFRLSAPSSHNLAYDNQRRIIGMFRVTCLC